jgi:hypothetical protein
MKWLLRLTFAMGLMGGAVLSAGTVTVVISVNPDSSVSISLDPTGGILSGYAGDTVGWGLSMTTTTDYDLYGVGSDFCVSGPPFTSPCTNSYTDFIAANGPAVYGAGPTSLSQGYDPTVPSGFGSLVVPGSNVVGELVFYYYVVPANTIPSSPNPSYVSVPAEVDVLASPVPEPAPWSILAIGLGALVGIVRRRR